ncbi:hypothetical protein GIB67_013035 [Kingdonia uniflora]|uniref:Uncharacterized protein n=1 Tax=Kingdonia uniflora TaxID=39325 RepID=A0A7J7MCX7_9MAGN|nr:hypothetical protein GIB67_013035 [Kingdonia uniflora]
MGLTTTGHPKLYGLWWIQKVPDLMITKQCTFKFAITERFIDDVMCEVALLDVCQVILGSPYLWIKDVIHYRRVHKYRLVKEGKEFHISACREHVTTSNLVMATQIFTGRIVTKTGELQEKKYRRDPEGPVRRSCGLTKSQLYALNAQCVAYKGIVAQERFRNSSGKAEKDRENDVHKIYKGLNGDNDFKRHKAYKIFAREPRWACLRDDELNHAVNIPRNVARRT